MWELETCHLDIQILDAALGKLVQEHLILFLWLLGLFNWLNFGLFVIDDILDLLKKTLFWQQELKFKIVKVIITEIRHFGYIQKACALYQFLFKALVKDFVLFELIFDNFVGRRVTVIKLFLFKLVNFWSHGFKKLNSLALLESQLDHRFHFLFYFNFVVC